MLTKEMTRKEFVTFLGAALGIFILRKLPFSGGGLKKSISQGPGSYGNHTYGGQKQ